MRILLSMNLSTVTAAQLKQALELREEIEALEQQLAAITGLTRVDFVEPRTGPGAESPEAEVKKIKPAEHRKHGAVKEAVIGMLKQAGAAGITVKEIATALGKSSASISIWFISTGKKVKTIKKLGRGKYGWFGASEASPAPYASIEAATKIKPEKSSTKKPKSKQYGGVKEAILNLVKASGEAGITVGELADKLGVKTGNIYSWFTSTGKKVKQIKKAGPGKYTWKA